MLYDVIVVGAGPAGSTAALELAQNGYQVLLLEKERLPRPKVCGGMISAKCLKLFDFDLSPVIEDGVNTLISTYRGKIRRKITYPGLIGHQISRDRFDFYLVKQAEGAGVEIRDAEEVTDIAQDEKMVQVRSTRGLYLGKLAIGADGVLSEMARSKIWEYGFSVIAEVYFKDKSQLENFSKTVLFDYGLSPGGYGWVFKKRDHLNVGVGTTFKKEFKNLKKYLSQFLAYEKLLQGEREIKFYSAPVAFWHKEEEPLVEGRLVLIGDAASLADPLTAEGIYYAVLSGRWAGQAASCALKSGDAGYLLKYEERVKREIIPEFKLAKRISNLFYKYAFILYHIGALDPRLMLGYYEVLAGAKNYRQFVDGYKKFVDRPLLRWIIDLVRVLGE